MSVYTGQALAHFLALEGLVPRQTANIELLVPASGAFMLRYEIYVTGEDCLKIARALRSLADAEGELREMSK